MEDGAFRFGEFSLFPSERRLAQGTRGLPLPPKAFDALLRGGGLGAELDQVGTTVTKLPSQFPRVPPAEASRIDKCVQHTLGEGFHEGRTAAGSRRCRSFLLFERFFKFQVSRITTDDGLLVMPLGEFLERRLLGRVNHREREMGVSPAGAKLHRFAERGLGCDAIPFLDEHFSQKEMGARLFGKQRGGETQVLRIKLK